jgi:DNA repair exonuclease SbcCD nuclease subunit
LGETREDLSEGHKGLLKLVGEFWEQNEELLRQNEEYSKLIEELLEQNKESGVGMDTDDALKLKLKPANRVIAKSREDGITPFCSRIRG